MRFCVISKMANKFLISDIILNYFSSASSTKIYNGDCSACGGLKYTKPNM